MYKLNNIQINNILKLWNNGKSMLSIAKELGIDNGTVKNYLVKNGYEIKYIPTKDEIENMKKFYNLGLSINQLHILFNRKGETISKHLKESGIIIEKRKNKLAEEQIEILIIEMYNFGLSMQKIMGILKIGKKKVLDILNKNNISIRDNSDYRIYTLNENYFDIIDSPNKAYILGFLYADGCVSKNKYNIQLSLQEGDIEILQKIKYELDSNAPLIFREFSKYNDKTGHNQQNQWALFIHSRHMHESLCKLGVVPQKTHGITYPDFLLDEFHSHFLRGVLDGDGCIHAPYGNYGKHKMVDICGTQTFCNQAKEVIEKTLGIHCSIIKINKNGSTYRITISGGRQVSKLLDWIYKDADLKLNRKYELYLKYYYKEKEKIA